MTLKIFTSLTLYLCLSSLLHTSELLKSTQTWEGEPIIYPDGTAEITSVKLFLKEGEVSKYHCHPVPTMGYILKGTIEVETKDGKKTIFKEGESAIEVLKTVHRGKAIGGPVELVIFYAGSTDLPNTVLPEHDTEHKHCKP